MPGAPLRRAFRVIRPCDPAPALFRPIARAAPWRHELELIGDASGDPDKNLVLGGVDLTLLFMLTNLLNIAPAAVGTLAVLGVPILGGAFMPMMRSTPRRTRMRRPSPARAACPPTMAIRRFR
jgi:hypothetical protein